MTQKNKKDLGPVLIGEFGLEALDLPEKCTQVLYWCEVGGKGQWEICHPLYLQIGDIFMQMPELPKPNPELIAKSLRIRKRK